MKNKESQVKEKILNYRELVERYETFGDNIAFKYKKDGEIKEITYSKFVEDIKKVAEKILDKL